MTVPARRGVTVPGGPVGSSEVRAGDEPEGAAPGSPPERGDSAVTQGDAA